MQNKKLQRCLLALACAFTMMSASVSVKAMEADDTYMSPRLTGSCGCVMWIESMSQRSCTDNKDGTHTAVYNTTYVCDHNRVNQTETIKEGHVYSGYYVNEGHLFADKEQKQDENKHQYSRSCRCGAKDIITLTCHGGTNSGGHAVP